MTTFNSHWTDGLSQVEIDAIEYECERQHVDEARRGYLRAGLERARTFSERGWILSMEILEELAGIIEPDSGGRIRITPVTFSDGGYAAPPSVVRPATEQLVRFWPEVNCGELEAKDWTRELLVVHPLSDGNGRLSFVLYNWLLGTLDEPVQLPYFFGEEAKSE